MFLDKDTFKRTTAKSILNRDRKTMGQKSREKIMTEFDEKLVIEKYVLSVGSFW